MNSTKITVAPALRALLDRIIDYAGIYPPASLPLDTAIANYDNYKNSEYAWMLRWLVVGSSELENVPANLDGQLSVLGESQNIRAAAIETKSVIEAATPTYCEVAVSELAQLDYVKQSGCFAKIRAGSVKPEGIPTCSEVAAFIKACAAKRLTFKATAGLHHPIRAEYALTYAADSPRATMHGFLNVLMASAFAWRGDADIDIEAIIAETDISAFRFDDHAHWRDHSLSIAELESARAHFVHSIGSCSFEEPVEELQAHGLFK